MAETGHPAKTSIAPPIAILKSLWSRGPDGRWGVADIKSLKLQPAQASDTQFFVVEGDVELMTTTPSKNMHEMLASFGTTDFLMKQSIVPVVAWMDGDRFIRAVGTASVISCSGYVLTAAHVLMDPFDRGYGAHRRGDQIEFAENLNIGVFIPANPAYGTRGLRYFPFEKLWFWGGWKESPLVHEQDRFEYSTDIAICKIPEMPHGAAHQPLSLSLNPFTRGEPAYSLGYAEMDDIPIEYRNGRMQISDFKMDLYASIGDAMRVFEYNSLNKDVPAPGPCFEFSARIPGKMSGAPIFGGEGVVVRGVVSRSFSGERHAFGAMLGPAMQLRLDEPQVNGRTLQTLMELGTEGIAQVYGVGL